MVAAEIAQSKVTYNAGTWTSSRREILPMLRNLEADYFATSRPYAPDLDRAVVEHVAAIAGGRIVSGDASADNFESDVIY